MIHNLTAVAKDFQALARASRRKGLNLYAEGIDLCERYLERFMVDNPHIAAIPTREAMANGVRERDFPDLTNEIAATLLNLIRHNNPDMFAVAQAIAAEENT